MNKSTIVLAEQTCHNISIPNSVLNLIDSSQASNLIGFGESVELREQRKLSAMIETLSLNELTQLNNDIQCYLSQLAHQITQ